jgi:hypothetical protein
MLGAAHDDYEIIDERMARNLRRCALMAFSDCRWQGQLMVRLTVDGVGPQPGSVRLR